MKVDWEEVVGWLLVIALLALLAFGVFSLIRGVVRADECKAQCLEVGYQSEGVIGGKCFCIVEYKAVPPERLTE